MGPTWRVWRLLRRRPLWLLLLRYSHPRLQSVKQCVRWRRRLRQRSLQRSTTSLAASRSVNVRRHKPTRGARTRRRYLRRT